MLNSTVLDVAIGLTYVYLILSLICTALNESWSKRKGLRGQFLKEGIHRMLSAGPAGNQFTQAFYGHPLIKSVTPNGKHPSYMSPRAFALALVDIVPKGAGPAAGQTLRESIGRMPESELKQTLRALLRGTDGSDEASLERIQHWFEDSMDRVSGSYKRKIQNVTLLMALIVTVVANADTLQMANQLWVNPTLRAAVVARAQERAKQGAQPNLGYANSPVPGAAAAQAQEGAQKQEAPPLNVGYTDPSPKPTPPVVTPSAGPATAKPSLLTQGDEAALGKLVSWSSESREARRRLAEAEQAKKYPNARACLDAKRTVDSPLCTGYSPTPISECVEARKVLAEPGCAETVKVVESEATRTTLLLGLVQHPVVLFKWIVWLIISRGLGWALTIIAISLGAPFWFGVLQKLVNIRSAGDAPDEKPIPATQPKPATGGASQ